ncbi:MAG: aminotransferase class I/II-fold pyridoxal phosphate-dependent enzyme [Alphaproteobacteria bacterium]|nr:aminotransferase class I/II-fold pyridoxal phosphate-dependent enzyme [Alphaproteobacteria bacterium]
MLNSNLALLPDYPFDRLRRLLGGVEPPPGMAPLVLSLGEPQHPYPDLVREVLAASAHLYGKYPPLAGTPELREAIRDWLIRRYGLPADFIDRDRHICPVAGTKEGLFMAALAAVPPAKAGLRPAVLMPNPFYQCYAGAAVAAGAEPLYLPATRQTGFLPDFQAVPEATLARTALVYLCSPANPQGSAASLDYLKDLLGLARRFDFILVIDECYAEIYLGAAPVGALQAAAALGQGLDRLMVFHSLSKRSSVPGLRSGFAASDERLMKAFLRLREYGGTASPLPVYAAATALWREESHVEANRSLYRQKFELAERALSNRFGFYRPDGGFFLWLEVGDGEQAGKRLWQEAAVRVLPGAYLAQANAEGDNPGQSYIRVALVGDAASTAEALSRLGAVL